MEKKAFESDEVNRPAHYNTGRVEVIEFIEDQGMNYHRGNAVKYLSRAGKKDPLREVEDLKKAAWYVAREIELLTKATPRRPNQMSADDLEAILRAKDEKHWDKRPGELGL